MINFVISFIEIQSQQFHEKNIKLIFTCILCTDFLAIPIRFTVLYRNIGNNESAYFLKLSDFYEEAKTQIVRLLIRQKVCKFLGFPINRKLAGQGDLNNTGIA